MADADVDGAHISALLLRMFVMYFPFLIEAGMVYKAIPPLFSIKEGKRTKYFTDNIDLIKYNQSEFIHNNTVLDNKKNPIEAKYLTKFFLRNTDYTYYLEKAANTYALDAYLLEMVLYHYIINKKSINVKKLEKEVNSVYRFMHVYNDNNTIIVKGTIDKSNLIILSDKFINDCNKILEIIESNDELYYYLNNKKASIYSIMKVYEASNPDTVQRYKGLGEMPDGHLGESTLSIDNRTLIRYTLDDAKEALNLIREYESDTKKILGHVGAVSRDDLVE